MRRRYSIRSATVTIFRPCRSQYAIRSGTRAIVPSSFMISQTTPAGIRPGEPREVDGGLGLAGALEDAAGARAEREDVAGLDEVVRASRSGRSRPGSCARGRAAEMPVVTPSRASIETVKAVPSGVSFCSVIWRRPSSSQRSSVRQRQISPRPCVAMKLTASGVANCAAIVRSPSFSRSSSSTTTTNVPCADVLDRLLDGGEERSFGASSGSSGSSYSRVPTGATDASVLGAQTEALDVLREHVDLEVDRRRPARARRASSPASVCGISATANAVVVERRDRQRDAVDRDRALLDAVAERAPAAPRRTGRRRPPARRRTRPTPVDVALDEVAAERLAGPQRGLEVDARPRPSRPSVARAASRARRRSAGASLDGLGVRQTPSIRDRVADADRAAVCRRASTRRTPSPSPRRPTTVRPRARCPVNMGRGYAARARGR